MNSGDKRPLQVDRDQKYVTIYTKTLRLTGEISVPLKGRMSDYLNKTLHTTDTFIPITNATCYDLKGNVLHHTDYMALNKNQIQLIIPNGDEG